jgi:hypothetical protein
MESENVSIQIVERGSAAIAVVDATFDLHNPGAATQLLVGFPDFVYGALPPTDAYSPVIFTPGNLTNFRAWTETQNFVPQRRQVPVGQYGGSEWFVWNMRFPAQQTVKVNVAYEQKLDEQSDMPWYRPIVHATYVLRTGALWAGTIGSAKVTFTATNGGGFVGAQRASEVSETKLIWQFDDFKPTFDPDAVYIYQAPWQELRSAERAVQTPNAEPADYLRAASAALRVLGREGPFGQPPSLVERYAPAMRSWAWQAVELDSADAWEAIGDVELYAAMPTSKHHGELACWPDAGAAAYERASERGSVRAAEKRAELEAIVQFMHDTPGLEPIRVCL